MCATCHHPIPYPKRHKGARYCSRACWRRRPTEPKLFRVLTATELVRYLNTHAEPLECVAGELGISRAHLYQCLQSARIVRTGRHGPYAVVHWRNPRQLSLF